MKAITIISNFIDIFLILALNVYMCAMKLTHIGENYPCLTDPNKGAKTPDNSSAINVSPFNATMSFMQVANWGKSYINLI